VTINNIYFKDADFDLVKEACKHYTPVKPPSCNTIATRQKSDLEIYYSSDDVASMQFIKNTLGKYYKVEITPTNVRGRRDVEIKIDSKPIKAGNETVNMPDIMNIEFIPWGNTEGSISETGEITLICSDKDKDKDCYVNRLAVRIKSLKLD
jgi:hypothetical protein